MHLKRYLVVNDRGTCKVTKNRPGLDWNEVCFELNLEIPNEMFKKPLLTADIKIPKDAINAPVIEADVIQNIEDAILENAGIEVRLNVNQPDNDEV